MSAPTMLEIAEKLCDYKKKDSKNEVQGYEHPVEIDSHTLVWAEYWLRYADEHLNH